MATPIEFYFDIASPYTYLASTQLDALGDRLGVEVVWRPFLLGGVFRATSNYAPANVAAKAVWMLQDLHDWAAFYGVPFTMNPAFPPNTLHVQRALVAAREDLGHDRMKLLAMALFRGYWVDGADVTDSETFKSVALAAGCDGTMLWARATDAEVKDRLRADTDEAIARGAFGAPTFFVGDKMWWGNDRLPLLERYLQSRDS